MRRSERASAEFLPKHFSSPYNAFLDLQRGAALGEEIAISFEAPPEPAGSRPTLRSLAAQLV